MTAATTALALFLLVAHTALNGMPSKVLDCARRNLQKQLNQLTCVMYPPTLGHSGSTESL